MNSKISNELDVIYDLTRRNRRAITAAYAVCTFMRAIRNRSALDLDGGMGALGPLPKPVVGLLADAVWETRGDEAWQRI